MWNASWRRAFLPHLLSGGLRTSPSLILSPQSQQGSWRSVSVGPHVARLQGLCSPNSRTEGRVRSRWQRRLCFRGGGAYTQLPEAGSWSCLHCVPLTQWLSGWQDTVAVVAPTGGTGHLPITGGTDVRLAHRLPGNPAEGHAPPRPFDTP